MILEAKIEDLDKIIEIENEVFTSCWNREQFEYELLENEFSNMYVIKEDEEIIGYAGLWILFERAEITTIAITTKYQGKKYGETLLRFLIEEAIKKGADICSLEVRVSNERAINLYRKLGFEVLRTRKNYYNDNHEDALEMIKVIGGLNEEDISD